MTQQQLSAMLSHRPGIGLWATEQNGRLDGKTRKPTTFADVAEFLQRLSNRVGIGYNEITGNGRRYRLDDPKEPHTVLCETFREGQVVSGYDVYAEFV